jgi:hypothetical protein
LRAEEQWVQRENRTLLAAGLEPTYEENDLWIKEIEAHSMALEMACLANV